MIDIFSIHKLQNEITNYIFSDDIKTNSFEEIFKKIILVFYTGEEQDLKGIISNHVYNSELWKLEDKARDRIAPDSQIAEVKRQIDKMNQMRNDEIERINAFLFEKLSPMNENAILNTETPGSVLDRLSILSLKKYHMKLQVEIKNVTDKHINNCKIKLQILNDQSNDLIQALIKLLEEITFGKRKFNLYYQVKMYNDPMLNPFLCKSKE